MKLVSVLEQGYPVVTRLLHSITVITEVAGSNSQQVVAVMVEVVGSNSQKVVVVLMEVTNFMLPLILSISGCR